MLLLRLALLLCYDHDDVGYDGGDDRDNSDERKHTLITF